MPKPTCIELPNGETIPILYEDRSVLAVDKPPHWMLVPFSWQKTSYNLQAALVSSIKSGAFWAKCRQLRFLGFVHRLDADTTGVLLFAKSPGALTSYGELFESRSMRKLYLAVVNGVPPAPQWLCRHKIGPHPERHGLMRVDARNGKDAETEFRVLETVDNRTLLEARPKTGRTHQIHLHLAADKLPIVGDELYGTESPETGLGLRAAGLAYRDPFTRREIRIKAPFDAFVRQHGFNPSSLRLEL